MRACIGRAFALQEGHIAAALILQNFNLQAVNPSYVMKLNQTLTIKPANFGMRASLREGLDPTNLERRLWGGKEPSVDEAKDQRVEEVSVPFIQTSAINALTKPCVAGFSNSKDSNDHTFRVERWDLRGVGNFSRKHSVHSRIPTQGHASRQCDGKCTQGSTGDHDHIELRGRASGQRLPICPVA